LRADSGSSSKKNHRSYAEFKGEEEGEKPLTEKDTIRLKKGQRYLSKLSSKRELNKSHKSHPVLAGYKG